MKANCTISVTFTPAGSGARTGSLTITDNAPASPQVISLNGNGSDFVLSASPPSTSIPAGQASSFALTITPTFGFNAKVTLNCSGIPAVSTCTISPASITPDGKDPVPATLTVTTGARTMAPPRSGPGANWPGFGAGRNLSWILWMIAFTLLGITTAKRRRGAYIGLGGIVLSAVMWVACGNGARFGGPVGTPAGTYAVTIGGTSGSVTHNTQVSLTVR